jgi:hypothetical protein
MPKGHALRLIPSLLLAAIVLIATPSQAQTFGSTVNVSKTKADSSTTDMAVSGSNVYVVWVDDKGTYQPLFSRSTNSGSSFSTGVQIFSGTSTISPHVAATGSNVYVARSARPSPKSPSQVYFRRSTDGGTTFGSQIQVSTASVDGAFFQSMAISGSNVYIVWTQWVSKWEVFFARSGDSGEHFGAPAILSATSGNTLSDINVVADGLNVHVAWTEYFGGGTSVVLYTRSTDGGTTFPYGRINVSNNVVATNVGPVLAASGSSVYVAWRAHASGETAPHMYFARSSDTGGSFSSPDDLSGATSDTLNIADGPYPELAVSGSNVHVIWHANPGGIYDVFYRGSHDSGVNFGSPRNISTPYGAPDYSPTPAISADGTNVYITWKAGSSTARDIYMAHSADNGDNFAPVDLSFATAGDSKGPQVIAAPGEVHVLWLDRTPGNWDVFYRRGTVPIP